MSILVRAVLRIISPEDFFVQLSMSTFMKVTGALHESKIKIKKEPMKWQDIYLFK